VKKTADALFRWVTTERTARNSTTPLPPCHGRELRPPADHPARLRRPALNAEEEPLLTALMPTRKRDRFPLLMGWPPLAVPCLLIGAPPA